MCFTRNLLDYILPVPQNIEMHDQWIGILNDLNNKNTIFIEEKLIRYRRHEATVTKIGKRYPIMKMVRNRINLVLALARKGKK